MDFEIFQKFRLAINYKASIMFNKDKTTFFVDKKIKKCDCEKISINLNLEGKTILMDLDDTILHNDFAEEIFPEYLQGCNSFKTKLSILKNHYLRLSAFSPDAFDWEDLYLKSSGISNFPELNFLQEKYYVWPHAFKFSGATKLLKNLKKLGCRIYAYTNGYSKYQKKLLEKLKLSKFFDDIYSPDITGVSKVDFFKKISLKSDDTVVIGDDYFFDIEVPSFYGFSTIWIYKYKKGPIGAPSAFPDYAFYSINSLVNSLLQNRKD